MDIPSFDGKKTNRMLFFLFLCITFAVLAVTSLMSIFKDGVELGAWVLLAIITGVMSCFYGIHWVYNIYKDRFMEKWFGDEEEEGSEEEDGEEDKTDAPVIVTEEFILPREHLLAAAGKRYSRTGICIIIAVLVLWLTAAAILAYLGVLKETSSLLRLLTYCALISVPGVIVYLLIRAGYRKSVPEMISFAPGKLAVDGNEYAAKDLESVTVSKDRSRDPASSFRQFTLFTEDGKERFRISCGADPEVTWEDYPRFTGQLSKWGKENGVTVSTGD